MKVTQFVFISSVGMLALSISTLQAATTGIPITVNSETSGAATTTGGGWGTTTTATSAVDNNEYSLAIGGQNAWIVFDFGHTTSFSDVSVTQRDYVDTSTISNTPNNFLIQVSASDNPANNDWVTVATASNIYGYDLPSANNYNAGRRIEFATQNKRYFRYVNANTAVTPYGSNNWTGPVSIAEVQVGRKVVITNSLTNVTSPSFCLNRATDGDSTTTMRVAGTSGSITFDALLSDGEGVKTITLQHSTNTNGYFLNGNVTVDASNDPTFTSQDVQTTIFNVNSTTTAGASYNLTFANAMNDRYYKITWSNTQDSGATYTEFAEIGFTTVAVPEAATMSLLAIGASFLMLRRHRR